MFFEYSEWHNERISLGLVQKLAIKSVLFSGTTKYQNIQIIDTVPYGRCLILDGKIQSTEYDEFIYHELLVHPAMLCFPDPMRILLAGGGEGASAREILRHNSVEKLTMVDLDKELVDLCINFFPSMNKGVFEDPRLEVKFMDILEYLKNSNEIFDVIIFDLPDSAEGSPVSQLYTYSFYKMAYKRLSPNGVIVTQSGPTDYLNYREVFPAIHNTINQIFPSVASLSESIPSFGDSWGFTIGSLSKNPNDFNFQEIDNELLRRGIADLNFYDGFSHAGSINLPKYLRNAIVSETRIITEENPLHVY